VEKKNLTKLVKFSDAGTHQETVFRAEHLWSEIICLSRNQAAHPMTDPVADAMFTVIAGEVVVYVDRKFKRFRQWDSTVAPAAAEVVIKNASSEPAVVLVVAAPPAEDP
jgi:glyoxylate utilization-related uncharacterized protein